MIKLVLAAATAVLAASSALAATGDLPSGASRAELVSPAPKPMYGVIDGRLWDCQGNVCTAEGTSQARAQGVADECHRAAKWLGKFTSYQTGATRFSGDQLTACNEGVTRTTPSAPE